MEKHVDTGKNGGGHELRDANVRDIVVSGAALAVGTFLVCMIAYGIFKFFLLHPPAPEPGVPAITTQQVPPQPRLQFQPYQEVRDLRAHEDHVLASYGWVDQKNGVVRIPINQAIDLLLQRGLPARKQQDAR